MPEKGKKREEDVCDVDSSPYSEAILLYIKAIPSIYRFHTDYFTYSFLFIHPHRKFPKKLYRPGLLTMRDVGAYNDLVKKIEKSCNAANKVYKDYLLFCRLNSLGRSDATSLGRFCCTLSCAGLDPAAVPRVTD